MTTARKLALKISNTILQLAPSGAEDWAKAMLREIDFIENDWVALLWALGGTRILLRLKPRCHSRDIHLTAVADIPHAAQILTNKVRARTLSVVVTMFESVAFGCILFLVPSPIQKLGSLLTVAAMLYMTYQLMARRVREVPTETDSTDRAIFYRKELERQRDFHRGWWLWSRLAIMLPGLIVFCAGGAVAEPKYLEGYAIIAAFFVGVCAVAVPANLRLARKYQGQLNELDAVWRKLE